MSNYKIALKQRQKPIQYEMLGPCRWAAHRFRGPKMSENNWRHLYDDAILELNVAVLKVRLQAAEDAIMTRALDPRVSQEERREMANALFTIRQLKKAD